ncbi:MAG: hypothetical protein ACE5J3_05725, partial [Methanosarcinales archaeon]
PTYKVKIMRVSEVNTSDLLNDTQWTNATEKIIQTTHDPITLPQVNNPEQIKEVKTNGIGYSHCTNKIH